MKLDFFRKNAIVFPGNVTLNLCKWRGEARLESFLCECGDVHFVHAKSKERSASFFLFHERSEYLTASETSILAQRITMKKHKSTQSACDAAIKYGIDLSLLDINLGKSPAERIRDMNLILTGVLKIRQAMKKNDYWFPQTAWSSCWL